MLVRVREFEGFPRSSVPRSCLARLEEFDRGHEAREGKPVFDWSLRQEVKATNWVGVLQVPGLQVEILPKLAAGGGEAASVQERRNLLRMLAVGGSIPVRERDLAGLSVLRESLLEVFITAFVLRLQHELRSGVDRSYHDVEESCPFLRGKLRVADQVRRNAAHKERFEVRYAVFGVDTVINRIIRASCRRLRAMSRRLANRNALQHAIQLLEDVDDSTVSINDFQRLTFTRSSERFRPLLDFCRLLFERRSPTQAADRRISTFSLLFPMETVFEAYVAGLIRGNAERLGCARRDVHVQAAGRHEFLMRSETNRRLYALRPDIVIDDDEGALILDTKWKRLDKRGAGIVAKPSTADVYQLYAYATRFEARRSILLFPKVPGAKPRTLRLEDSVNQELLVRFLDLDRDLKLEESALLAELDEMLGLRPGMGEGLAHAV